MGKTYTPKYRVEYQDQKGWHWSMPEGIRASKKWAEEERRGMNSSFQPGGVNWHVSEALEYVPHVSRLRVIRQRDNKIMAEVTAPMFEVA